MAHDDPLDSAISSLSSRSRYEKRSDVQVPSEFCCVITQDIYRDPVVTSVGQTYERSAIEGYWNAGGYTYKDPLSNVEITDLALVPNYALRRMIQDFLDTNPDFMPESWPNRELAPADTTRLQPSHREARAAASLPAAGQDGGLPLPRRRHNASEACCGHFTWCWLMLGAIGFWFFLTNPDPQTGTACNWSDQVSHIKIAASLPSRWTTLEDAKAACQKELACGGITHTTGQSPPSFELRAGSLTPSTPQSSWICTRTSHISSTSQPIPASGTCALLQRVLWWDGRGNCTDGLSFVSHDNTVIDVGNHTSSSVPYELILDYEAGERITRVSGALGARCGCKGVLCSLQIKTSFGQTIGDRLSVNDDDYTLELDHLDPQASPIGIVGLKQDGATLSLRTEACGSDDYSFAVDSLFI